MDFKTKIVHWNCRGLKPNYNDILLLLSLLKPSVFVSKKHKANWEQFHLLCEQDLSMDNFNNSPDLVTDFTSSLMKISDKCRGVVGWCEGAG